MSSQKLEAIALRSLGYTYREIQEKVPVSKSTLSLWLQEVQTPPEYQERIKILRDRAVKAGTQAIKSEKINRLKLLEEEARNEMNLFKLDTLWVVGLTLYWAEGSKEKEWGKAVRITFTNMDPDTVIIFKLWCKQYLQTREEDFIASLYIHESRRDKEVTSITWWSKKLGIREENIRVYYKRSSRSTVRKNEGDLYYGVFRLQVRRSADLNRKIAIWTKLLAESLK